MSEHSESGESNQPYPDKPEVRWSVPNSIAAKTTGDYFGLTLYGTYNKNRVTGNGTGKSIMPQPPAEVVGLAPVRSQKGKPPSPPATFSDLVNPARDRHRRALGEDRQMLCHPRLRLQPLQRRLEIDLIPPGHARPRSPAIAVPAYFTFSDFESKKILGKVDGKSGRRVKYVTKQLFRCIRELKAALDATGENQWEDFPNEWPPECYDDGEYRITSRPRNYELANGNHAQFVVVTVHFLMDTQNYRIPRGFSIEVTGDEVFQGSVIKENDSDSSSSSSSSSCAYSCESSAMGDDVLTG